MNAPELPFYVRHAGRVTPEGGLRIANRDAFESQLRELAGQPVRVLVEPEHRTTDAAMRYYRGCVIPIIATELMGEVDFDYVHEEVAHKFLKLPPDPKTGARRRRSTAKGAMNRKAFGWYLEQVIVWATVDCGLIIPEPDSVGYRYEIPEAA